MRAGEGYLSKREQQIMELVYQHEKLSAAEVMEKLPGNPSNSTVRTLLRILEEKGQLRHDEQGGRFIYLAAHPRQSVARKALSGVVDTFFKGSVENVVLALISPASGKLSNEELDRLQALIDEARKETP